MVSKTTGSWCCALSPVTDGVSARTMINHYVRQPLTFFHHQNTYSRRNFHCIDRLVRHDRSMDVRLSNTLMAHRVRSYDPNDTDGSYIAILLVGPNKGTNGKGIRFRFRRPNGRQVPRWLAIPYRCSNEDRRIVQPSHPTHRFSVFDIRGCVCMPGRVSSTDSQSNRFLENRTDKQTKKQTETVSIKRWLQSVGRIAREARAFCKKIK